MTDRAVYGKLVEEMETRGLRVFADYTGLTDEQRLRVKDPPPRAWNQVYPHYPNFFYRIQFYDESATPSWSDDWEEAAGAWTDTIKAAGNMFGDGVMGLAHKPYFEWLRCSVCREVQPLPKSAGAPSAKCKCIMSFKCQGIMRRLPNVYEILLKVPKTKKPASSKKNLPRTTETRGRKGYSAEVKAEALRLSATGLSGSDVARALRISHPEAAKVNIATVIQWIKAGKELPIK